MKNLKFNYSIATNKGIKPANEDSCWIGSNRSNQYLAIICDGISIEQKNYLASSIIVNYFRDRFLKKSRIIFFERWFKKTLKQAYLKLHFDATKNSYHTGTTLTMCIISGNKARIFNIGDSRTYHFSSESQSWKQITEDHNLYNFLEKRNAPSIAFVRNKNSLLALTQYIDSVSTKHMKYDAEVIKLMKDDLLFLASDGLYNYIAIDEINKTIMYERSMGFQNISDSLIKKALDNQSNDNLSGIVIECLKK